MNGQIRAASELGAGILALAIVAACDGGSDAGILDANMPAAARIGNVATATLEPASGSTVSGTVTFAELDDALQVEAEVAGLTPGEHGFHIHQIGDCSAPDASSAGGHWSPADDPHGAPAAAESRHHAGDLGNLTAGAGGEANLIREDRELTLVGDYGVVGKSVIVHSGADDLDSQPAGEAGARIACGLIEWGTDSG